MTILLWRWTLLLSTLWLLPVLLIHAQPYDDGGLRNFLMPSPQCPAPCFLGIRPGVTTAEETMSLLSQHRRVPEDYYDGPYFMNPESLTWQWDGPAADWLDGQTRLRVLPASGPVQYVYVEVNLRWGELQLALGRPDFYSIALQEPDPSYLVAWYGDQGVLVEASGQCGTRSSLYDWPVELRFQPSPPENFRLTASPPIRGCR